MWFLAVAEKDLERERERGGRGIERKIEGFGREENKEWGWSV